MFGLDITPVAYGSLVSRVRYFAAILRAEASRCHSEHSDCNIKATEAVP